MSEDVAADLAVQRDAVLGRLIDLVRLPSVSADPAFAQGMADAQAFLQARLRDAGLDNVQLLQADGGHPTVYGEWLGAPGRPTLLIYGHYDVQPPDPLDKWVSPPFEPEVREGRLYGRGASDTKATVTIAMETVAAFLRRGACPVNVRFFLEGEEEVGSPSLRAIIDTHRSLLQADAVLSADGARASVAIPTISTGTRGLAKLDLTVRTAAKDLHSGRFGGATRNALHELARLVTSLHDDAGRIQVPGFTDDLQPITNRERTDAAALDADTAGFYAGFRGLPHGDPAFTLRERITLCPTIEVNGMWGGYLGAGSKTVIPCEAHAKLTMRLGRGQDPDRAAACAQAYLRSRCPPGVELLVDAPGGGSAASNLPEGYPLLAAADRVIRRVADRAPVRARGGGTLPITAIFHEMLGIDTLRFAFGMPDEDVHAPNEFFRLSSLDEGLRAWPLMLTELGGFSPAEFGSSGQ